MNERIRNYELSLTETIWRALGEIEWVAHGGTLSPHAPDEQIAVSWTNHSGTLCRRVISYEFDEDDGVSYWPVLVMIEDGREEIYSVVDDEDVLYCTLENPEGESDEAATWGMIYELQEALNMMREDPNSFSVSKQG